MGVVKSNEELSLLVADAGGARGVSGGGDDDGRRRRGLLWIVRAAAVLVLLTVAAVVLRGGGSDARRSDDSRLGDSAVTAIQAVPSPTEGDSSGVGGDGDGGPSSDELVDLAGERDGAEGGEGGEDSVPRLPIYFHVEKTGGTSLVLYLLSLLSDTPDQVSLVQRTRREDNIFDAELRRANLLCPGSAMFLTTVFVDNAESFTSFPKPLKDSSRNAWRGCRLATSHQGQALQTMVRADMARVGIPERDFVTLGMFRDPVQFEQAAWRSELFMYHADRKTLGWGSLSESKFGTRISKASLADFSDTSEFATTMSTVHCTGNRDNNYQTRKLIDDQWWRFQERIDAGTDAEELHAEAVDLALDRVSGLAWVGLTHRFEESMCTLAFVLRKAPVDTEVTNYDRGGLISEAFRGNHPHSGSAWEGGMSTALRTSLYECNAMDTLLVKAAANRWEEDMRAMEAALDAAAQAGGNIASAGFGGEELDPVVYQRCLAAARQSKSRGEAGAPVQEAEESTASLGSR
mmetsp:Transcript_9081/g.14421  ORF Transcript_9081/g.14421 Transcript_9081/m.14421 type:complete len:518 (-) Transcript_9081:218-1771(-)